MLLDTCKNHSVQDRMASLALHPIGSALLPGGTSEYSCYTGRITQRLYRLVHRFEVFAELSQLFGYQGETIGESIHLVALRQIETNHEAHVSRKG